MWDLVVDIRGSAMAWMVPTKRRAIFRRRLGHKTLQLASMLDLSPAPAPVAWTSEADRHVVDGLLPAGRPIIVLAPTANWQPKVWPAERFAAAFLGLAESGMVPVVLGGAGPTERAMAAPLLDALPEAIDLVGQLTVPQATAVLQRATLFIGNDSGLMHLAAAAGTPTIGLFGPTDAATYAPTGRLARAVTGTSMDAISVAQVVAAAESLTAPA
jgi:ADP-heptose:LPS heptosyltransferase